MTCDLATELDRLVDLQCLVIAGELPPDVLIRPGYQIRDGSGFRVLSAEEICKINTLAIFKFLRRATR